MEAIKYNNIRGHIFSEVPKEIEPMKVQKLKSFLENFESSIKIAKETYVLQLKVLKEELHLFFPNLVNIMLLTADLQSPLS